MCRQIAALFQTDTGLALVTEKTEFVNFALVLGMSTEPALGKFAQAVYKPLLAAARMFRWRGNLHKLGLAADK